MIVKLLDKLVDKLAKFPSALLWVVWIFSIFSFLTASGIIWLNPLFLQIPSPSDAFDCDDAALKTIDKFAAIGLKVFPVVGNLAITGEKYSGIDHAWAVIELPFNRVMAFDWGRPEFDKQHYEYYPITRERLLAYVIQDFINNGIYEITTKEK